MCLIIFAYKTHPEYQLILLANRDEFYARPTAPLRYWDDAPLILAGRDQKKQGTWLGITTNGRFAALTNFRDPHSLMSKAPSRGQLVRGFLSSKTSPHNYLKKLHPNAKIYNGFNLLTGDQQKLCYYSNRSGEIKTLSPGIYGLSNAFLNDPWPKVTSAMTSLTNIGSNAFKINTLFEIIADRSVPPDNKLPDTGIGIIWERLLASIFIASDSYGTRSSTVLLISNSGEVRMVERTFSPFKKPYTHSFKYKINP